MQKTIVSVILLATLQFLHAEEVTLYLEPDRETEAVAELEADDERLVTAESVMDEPRQAEGWYWFEYEGTFTGFVQNKEIGKDLEVKPGAFVFLRPTETSPVLATIEKGDTTELIWAGDWTEIRFTKAVPVYFQKFPSVFPEIVPQIGTDSTPPALDERVVSSDYVAPEIGRAAAVSSGPSAGGIPRYFEGVFEQSKQSIGREPKYRYQIVGSDGKRIAFVETEAILISTSLEKFIGREVILYGDVTTIKKSKIIVVNARTLRLR